MKNVIAGYKGGFEIPIADRFFEKVVKTNYCWLWTGATRGKKPYGILYDRGRRRAATHISWEIANGKPFPDGLDACHTCDNTLCVCPDHIFPGTRKDNMQDAASKGKLGSGNRSKTHCKNGHPLSGDNLSIIRGKHRRCKTCAREARVRLYWEHKAQNILDSIDGGIA